MKFDLAPMSRDFTMISALERPGLSLPRLRNAPSDWVVIERPMTPMEHDFIRVEFDSAYYSGAGATVKKNDAFYYVVAKNQLLELLKDDDLDFTRSLRNILNLHESDSNDTIFTEGFAYNFGQRTRGLSYTGRFNPAALVLDNGVPIGVLPPPAGASGIRPPESTRTGFEATGPSSSVSEAPVPTTVAAEFPRLLEAGAVAELEVTLAFGNVQLAGQTAQFELAPESDVTIRLSLSDNLAVKGGKLSERTKVPAPAEERHLLFPIQCLAAGPAQIIVRLYQTDQSHEEIGSLKLLATVTAPGAAASSPPEPSVKVTAMAYPPSGCAPPDLILYIEEMPSLGGPIKFRFRVTSGPTYPNDYEDMPFGSVELTLAPNLYFQDRFTAIEGLPFYDHNDVKVIDYKLRSEGKQLFLDLFSLQLQNELHKFGDRITTVLIKTDGHHVPWEMILLPATADRPEEFLSQRYHVTRWTEGFRPAKEICLRKMVYVAPAYQQGQRLPFAANEVTFLRSIQGPFGIQATEVDAFPLPVFDAIDNTPFDVFHYVGHAVQAAAKSADFSSLQLQTEEKEVQGTLKRISRMLEPNDLLGKGPRWSPRRPLIFLNACQTGRQDLGLVRPGGWASAVLRSQAGAFVGTLWSVRDSAAFAFCQAFYNALLAEKTFGASATIARNVVAATGDPSWLAYVVYAHPNAKLTHPTPLPPQVQAAS
jgi:hypothetical protein